MALMPRSRSMSSRLRALSSPARQTDIVRSLVGFIVRVGAPVPGIYTVEAFKVLRRANSISHSQGPSGFYVAGSSIASASPPK